MDADVIIIGSGQAGVPLATRLAHAGKRVIVVERGELGGTCINTGCTPTKTMVASARAAHVARTAARLGVQAGDVKVDFAAVISRKDAIVRRWRDGVTRRLGEPGERLRLVRGHARFVGDRTIEAAGERYRAEMVIINVGARAARAPIPGIDASHTLDNHSIMGLRDLPPHLLVVGGGYIGCEFAQMFRRFGAEVTIVQRATHLLDREDPEVSTALEQVFRDEGIHIVLGESVAKGAQDGSGVSLHLASGAVVRGSHLLVAVGRRPNTDDLGCDAGGVALDARGYVVVDDGYATKAPGVYAVGDATAGPQFTHASWDDHRILFDRLMARSKRGRADRLIPYAVFTDPQVAGVGLSEREARERGIPHELASLPFGSIARAIEVDETAGLMKVLFDPSTERILGARLMGAEAGELIHVFAVLMRAGATLRAVVEAEFVHPTFAEGLQSLVMTAPRYALA